MSDTIMMKVNCLGDPATDRGEAGGEHQRSN
jgi:hypothetical protein